MNYKKWLLLTISALLYSAAYVFSPWLWWLAFFIYTPLFYAAATEQLSFKEGLFWGSIVFSGNLWGVFYSLVRMSTGTFVLKLLPLAGMALYLAFYAALWFWISHRLILFCGVERSVLWRLCIWVVTSFLYVCWMQHCCLFVFNYCEGYFLVHPLVPLAEYTPVLTLLPWIGIYVLSLLLLVTNCLWAAIFLVTQKRYTLLCVGLAILPWGISIWCAPTTKAPAWLKSVAVLPMWVYEPFDLTSIGTTVQYKIREILRKRPDVAVVILPESALFKCNLESASELAHAWDKKRLGKAITIMVGAARWEKTRCYNSAYLLYDGAIQSIYDKRHTMMLIEGLASWWDNTFVYSLFYKNTQPLTASEKPHVVWNLHNGISCVPYICSELFFNIWPDDSFSQVPIALLCNDTWSSISYIQRIMYLIVRLKALHWQRDIIYAGYAYAMFCGKDGGAVAINPS